MTTPDQAAPPADGQAATPQQQPEQPQNQQQTPANPQEQAAPAVSPEEIATLRAQAAQAAQLQESYKQLQGEFTRKSQILAAMAGQEVQQPKSDPRAQYYERLAKQGIHADDAKAIVDLSWEMTDGLRQQLAQTQAATQNTAMLGSIMQNAYQMDPALFSDPEIAFKVENALRNQTLAGQQVDANYAMDLAIIANHYKQREQAQRQPAFQPMANQPPAPFQARPQFGNGMFGVNNGFNAAQPTPANQVPGHLQALKDETAKAVQSRYNFTPQQR